MLLILYLKNLSVKNIDLAYLGIYKQIFFYNNFIKNPDTYV